MNHKISPDTEFAKDLRGFGPLGILSIIIILLTGNINVGNIWILPLGALLVLLWAKLSNTAWRDIGYVKPKNWLLTILYGILFGVFLKFLLKAVIMPLLGADPVNQSYHFLAGNKALLPAAIWAMLAAGFGEETVFRGYFFERLQKLFGKTNSIKSMIVLVTTLLFAFSHYFNQGWWGVEQAFFTGLAFGSIFAVTGSIWMVIIAHACFDLTALAMIYWNVETQVAHLIFK